MATYNSNDIHKLQIHNENSEKDFAESIVRNCTSRWLSFLPEPNYDSKHTTNFTKNFDVSVTAELKDIIVDLYERAEKRKGSKENDHLRSLRKKSLLINREKVSVQPPQAGYHCGRNGSQKLTDCRKKLNESSSPLIDPRLYPKLKGKKKLHDEISLKIMKWDAITKPSNPQLNSWSSQCKILQSKYQKFKLPSETSDDTPKVCKTNRCTCTHNFTSDHCHEDLSNFIITKYFGTIAEGPPYSPEICEEQSELLKSIQKAKEQGKATEPAANDSTKQEHSKLIDIEDEFPETEVGISEFVNKQAKILNFEKSEEIEQTIGLNLNVGESSIVFAETESNAAKTEKTKQMEFPKKQKTGIEPEVIDLDSDSSDSEVIILDFCNEQTLVKNLLGKSEQEQGVETKPEVIDIENEFSEPEVIILDFCNMETEIMNSEKSEREDPDEKNKIVVDAENKNFQDEQENKIPFLENLQDSNDTYFSVLQSKTAEAKLKNIKEYLGIEDLDYNHSNDESMDDCRLPEEFTNFMKYGTDVLKKKSNCYPPYNDDIEGSHGGEFINVPTTKTKHLCQNNKVKFPCKTVVGEKKSEFSRKLDEFKEDFELTSSEGKLFQNSKVIEKEILNGSDNNVYENKDESCDTTRENNTIFVKKNCHTSKRIENQKRKHDCKTKSIAKSTALERYLLRIHKLMKNSFCSNK